MSKLKAVATIICGLFVGSCALIMLNLPWLLLLFRREWLNFLSTFSHLPVFVVFALLLAYAPFLAIAPFMAIALFKIWPFNQPSQ